MKEVIDEVERSYTKRERSKLDKKGSEKMKKVFIIFGVLIIIVVVAFYLRSTNKEDIANRDQEFTQARIAKTVALDLALKEFCSKMNQKSQEMGKDFIWQYSHSGNTFGIHAHIPDELWKLTYNDVKKRLMKAIWYSVKEGVLKDYPSSSLTVIVVSRYTGKVLDSISASDAEQLERYYQ